MSRLEICRNILRAPDPNTPHSCIEYFDFYERDVEMELDRLGAWVNLFAASPLRLPEQFVVGQPKMFTAIVRVPDGPRWKPMSWLSYRPLLVFNYGHILLQHGSRIPETCEEMQVVVPLVATEVAGEVTGEVVLSSSGLGHVVLTIGEPAKTYAYPDGGLASERKSDILLWWDFSVSEPRE
jgi:hypothetical protein